jgi:hypothetical protein
VLPSSVLLSSEANAPLDPSAARHAEALELAFRRSSHRPLCFVDLELEQALDEAGDIALHPFPCPLAAHVDVAIVCIPHEVVVAPLQFPFKWVEYKIRQQWRECGPPCGIPSFTEPTSPFSVNPP